MTSAIFYCTQQCLFCWRAQSGDLQTSWNELRLPKWDSPEEIVEGSIGAQHAILSGYKDNPRTNKQKLREAQTPRHVAISLTGEPTLYSHIGERVRKFHKNAFTTFLVSNGTMPSALAKLSEEPTQLYISVCAPDKETFKKVCCPQISGGWEELNKTLDNLPNFKCPKIIRITSVRDLNMRNIQGYARLIRKAEPTYIEVKAYMYVGFSRRGPGDQNTPSHDEIREFSKQLANLTGYDLTNEYTESRVALLSKLESSRRFGNG
jgi:tRNA wybutosine-synthesizing protein 1